MTLLSGQLENLNARRDRSWLRLRCTIAIGVWLFGCTGRAGFSSGGALFDDAADSGASVSDGYEEQWGTGDGAAEDGSGDNLDGDSGLGDELAGDGGDLDPSCTEPELCDAIDNNCNGLNNEGCGSQCGTMATLADNFDDGTIGTAWAACYQNVSAGVLYEETGGRLVLSHATSPGLARCRSEFYFNMVGDQIFVEVPQPLDPATQASAVLGVSGSGPGAFNPMWDFEIGQSGDRLFMRVLAAGVPGYEQDIAFDPVLHRWWRMREELGTFYFETAEDGVFWTEVGTTPVSLVVDAMVATLRLEVPSSPPPTAGGSVEFDNLNGGAEPNYDGQMPPPCPISAVTDDFNDLQFSSLWTLAEADGGSSLGVTSGWLRASPPDGMPGNVGIASANRQRVEGESVSLKVVGTTSTSTTAATAMLLVDGDDNAIGLRERLGVLELIVDQGGVSVVASIPYDSADHTYWRISIGAEAVAEVSPDGTDWTEVGTTNPGFIHTPEGLFIELLAQNPDGFGGVGSAEFDDLNILP